MHKELLGTFASDRATGKQREEQLHAAETMRRVAHCVCDTRVAADSQDRALSLWRSCERAA